MERNAMLEFDPFLTELAENCTCTDIMPLW